MHVVPPSTMRGEERGIYVDAPLFPLTPTCVCARNPAEVKKHYGRTHTGATTPLPQTYVFFYCTNHCYNYREHSLTIPEVDVTLMSYSGQRVLSDHGGAMLWVAAAKKGFLGRSLARGPARPGLCWGEEVWVFVCVFSLRFRVYGVTVACSRALHPCGHMVAKVSESLCWVCCVG